MRTLNVKSLLILLGLGTAMVAAVLVTHYLQTGRIVGALLARTSAAEEQGQLRLATLYLSRYLEFKPADVESRARLGRLLADKDLAVTPQARARARLVLEQVLGRDPDRRDSRRQLVRLALEVGNLELAREHLRILCDSPVADAEAEELRGRLSEVQGQYAEAADWYRRAVGHDAGRVESAARLADVLRRHPAPKQAEAQAAEADQVIDALVAKNDRDPKAYLARWRYRTAFTEVKKDADARRKAAQDVARARELAPDDTEVTAAVAQLDQLEGRVAEARAALKRGLEQHPQGVGLYQALAALEMQAGERKAATDVLRLALKKLPAAAQGDFLWSLAHLLLDGGAEERTEATSLIAQMRRSGGPSASADYLQGRLFLVEQKPAEAARLLERARPILGNVAEVGEQIDLALGRCYEQLNDAARQKDAYDRLAGRASKSLPVLLGLASAEASLGNLDAAIVRYREAAGLPGAPAEVSYAVVALLVARNLERDAADWGAVETALREAEKAKPGAAEVPLLRAEALAAQNKLDEARKVLEAACAADAGMKEPRLRLALAAVLTRRGEAAGARALFDEVERQAGDIADLREARARFWGGRPREEVGEPLARLAQGLEQWKSDEQSRVLRAVAEAYLGHGEFAKAEALCVRLAALAGSENDVGLRLLLCELSAQTGNDEAGKAALDDLKRIEGGEGLAWSYGRAVRLTAAARRGQTDGLPEARRLLDRVASLRPGWAVVVLARGEVAELQNRPEEAIAHYREAIRLGERGERVSRRLVELLYRQQRYREAEEELAQLRRRGPLSHQMELLAADLSLRNRDPVRAARIALQAASAGASDYRDVLWLGQILAAAPDQVQEAEKHLRRALEMEDKVPETWVALIQFLAVRGKTKEAQDLLARAEGRLAADKRPLALAPCYEALGQLDQAQEQYRQALRTRRDDVVVLRAVGGFYLRWLQPQAAEPLLRRIIDKKVSATEDDVAWAQLGLAVALATRGDHPSFVEALSLVGLKRDDAGRLTEEKGAGEDTIERRRAQAHVLATRASRTLRGKAIELLEGLDARQGLPPGDRLLLSQLYEVNDAWPKAEAQLRRLAEAYGREPTYLSRLAQNLLQQNKPDEARPVYERLEALAREKKLPAGSFGTVELKARLLEATGAGDQAVALLKAHAGREGARPDEVLLPIQSLTRQKRYDTALELMEQAWQTKCPPDVLAGAHVGVLRAANLTGAPLARAERLVRAAAEAAPKNEGLLMALAGLQDQAGRFEEAEASYRRLLAVDENDPRALNNLAWLLALHGRKGAEALPLIQRAIDQFGPRPDLLDTRALVYLALEQPDKARADLKASIADTPAANRYLHLARVCQMTDDAAGTAAALREARALGLKRAQLHPVEVAACTKLLEGVE
jgi:tetratricopeptide (TPR) repeat protein